MSVEREFHGRMSLAELADWHWTVNELHEDEDLDRGDHLEIVRRAYLSADCGDLAAAVNAATGWPVLVLGTHAFNRAPDGRLLDASGWTDVSSIRKRYGLRGRAAPVEVEPLRAVGCTVGEDVVDGYDRSLSLAVSAMRALPVEPFSTAGFRELSEAEVEGVDVPRPSAAPSRR